MAKWTEKRFGGSYLWGIWKEDLPAQLLWETSAPQARLINQRAPSWSWISIDGAVYLDEETWEGPVTNSYYTISIILHRPTEGFLELGIRCQYLVCTTELKAILELHKSEYEGIMNARYSPDTNSNDEWDASSYFLPIRSVPIHHEYFQCTLGLIIRAIKDHKGKFHRLGYYKCPLGLERLSKSQKFSPDCHAIRMAHVDLVDREGFEIILV